MRILHILDHSIPLHSGYTFRTAALLREQRLRGWKTFHLTSPKQGICTVADEEIDGLHFFRTPVRSGWHTWVPLLRERAMMRDLERRIEEVVKQIKPDLLHAHSPVLNALPALAVGRRTGIPVVYEVRAFWEDAAVDHGTTREGSLRYRVTRALETRALRQADHVFTICEGLRADIAARGLPDSKVTVIPNAVDVAAFDAGAAPDAHVLAQLGLQNGLQKRTVIGFIGSFYAYEGLDLLIDALPKVLTRIPNSCLLLVGGGPQEAALKARALALGVGDKVIFTGRVPHHQVQGYYDAVDVLAYPRHSMRLTELVTPLKPLEAMAQQRLFVASDVGGHRELIQHGKTGVLFKAGDAEALAASIVDLLGQPQRWPALKQAGRAFVENVRNWRNSVAAYAPVYERLVPGQSGGTLGRSTLGGSTPGGSTPGQRRPIHVVVLSSLFPSAVQPVAGLFVRERMFRLGQRVNLCVVAPAPWFPLQRVLRFFRPHFRPGAPRHEKQTGFDVWYPRYFSFPGVLKRFDAMLMALGAYPRLWALQRAGRLDLIDAHFAFPDGCAAVLLGRWFGVPVSVTLRGSEVRQARDPYLARRLAAGLHGAQRIFAVAGSLKTVAVNLGIPAEKIEVVGNGVDAERFAPIERSLARTRLQIAANSKVLVSVGGLVPGKGFHRVIEVLPALMQRFPGLVYLVVGGPSLAGDMRAALAAQVERLGLSDHVRFMGQIPPQELAGILSAADVFVLATANEGWANVFLEAMACGLPVVTTEVGGNREVVCSAEVGTLVPFGDAVALREAVATALEHPWDRQAIRRFAERNTWTPRIDQIDSALTAMRSEYLRTPGQAVSLAANQPEAIEPERSPGGQL